MNMHCLSATKVYGTVGGETGAFLRQLRPNLSTIDNSKG